MCCRRNGVPFWVVILCAAALAVTACGGGTGGRGSVTRLSIATGGTGGVYYPYGGALATVISTNLPGVQATAEVTAASIDNLKLIRDRQADLGFTLADTLAEAVKGHGPFSQGGPVPVRALAVLYHNFTQVVVRDHPDVTGVAGLKGLVVSVGAAGSGTELLADRLLSAAGLDPARDIVRQSLGVAQSVDQLKDGKIDAFFWSGGVPTAALLDLASTPGLRWHLVATADLIPALQVHGPGLYAPIAIPKAAYPGMAGDVTVVGVANVLAVHEAMPEPLAHDITRLLFEQQAQLARTHPEAEKLSLTTATTGSPAAFHPGAIRFYREKGAWRE